MLWKHPFKNRRWQKPSKDNLKAWLKRSRKPLILGTAALSLALLLYGIGTYLFYIRALADPQQLMNRNQTGLTILDRNEELIYQSEDVKDVTYVTIDQIPEVVQQATIAIEDQHFYDHSGFSIRGIARSVYLNLRTGSSSRFGGSTITQQLVKNAILSPEKSLRRKYQELILALEIERRYDKDTILEMYLNSIYYGAGAYGVETASQTYFGKPASQVNLAEASILAALPRAPSRLSPYSGDRAALTARQQLVLTQMADLGFITPAEAEAAQSQEVQFARSETSGNNLQAPHFAVWLRDLLYERYGEDTVIRSGFRVTSTIDSRLQRAAQNAISQQMPQLRRNNASNAALVSIDPRTGEVMAMVGSYDWQDEEVGQYNVAFANRQPGSSFKPIVYTRAFMDGWQPGDTLEDVETDFGGGYKPRNYDGRFRGEVTIRRALANSLNIPAVKLLDEVGIRRSVDFAHDLGISSLDSADQLGLSLVLGGGEVELFELTRAYGVFANQGNLVPTHPVLKIEDKNGGVRYTYDPENLRENDQSNRSLLDRINIFNLFKRNAQNIWGSGTQQKVDAVAAYFTTHILSDNQARAEVFGSSNYLMIGRPAAAKTGTTNDNKDAWTVGYTPSLVTGVWVGNNDGSSMTQIGGSLAAAPIWNTYMRQAHSGQPVEQFVEPSGIEKREICSNGRQLSCGECEQLYTEIFRRGRAPRTRCASPTPSPSESPSPSPTPEPTPEENDGDDDQDDQDPPDQPAPQPTPIVVPPPPSPILFTPPPSASPRPPPSPTPETAE